MPPTPPTTPNPGEPLIRDRGDACPGALRLHAADDGRLARLRLPAGLLTARQVWVLATAAEVLGDGRVSVTSRGNVELRGLGEGCGAELAELLAPAGLLPSPTHERVRNVVASPAAGLDGLGGGDVQLWARELDALLCAREGTAALSGRFLFVLDDGRGDVAGLGGDVTLIAAGAWAAGDEGTAGSRASDGPADRAAPASRGGVGTQHPGTPGTDGPSARGADSPGEGAPGTDGPSARGADSPGEDGPRAPGADGPRRPGAYLRVGARVFRVAATDAPRAAVAAAEAFLVAAHGAGNGAWRVRELPEGHEPDLVGALARAGIAAEPVPPTEPPHGEPPAPGVLGETALHVLAPLGRLTAEQLRALAATGGEVRLTPWRGAVVTGFPDRTAAARRLRALDAYGLITDPDSPWAGVGACTGRPGCAKSLADVRADATPGRASGLPVHFSGCARRCGHPQGPHGTWVDVVATGEGAYLVDGVPTSRTSLTEAVATARTTARTTR
ncbi:cobalamin biosynthesis protein CobG [Streptomyces sp. NPDC002992]|uniref:cobalamin biosynthesis protein CobG n=1 Tax=Streptomyces sp. NPDC002992 TaxID=3154273 RepID=UPI0033A3BFED